MSQVLKSNNLNKYYQIWFLVFLALTIADKIWMLYNYAFKYSDDDQAVVMMAARDMLHGHFYQPCFYGQSYNPLIESFLAVPLLALHLPGFVALPIVAAVLGLLPFLLFAFLYRKKHPLVSLLALALPLALPWFYSFMVIMPRGYMTGMAVASVASALVLSAAPKKWLFFTAGFLSIIALTANPNCGIFLAPVWFFAWLNHYKSRNFYVFLISGILLSSLFPAYIYWFYLHHPDYIVHGMRSVIPSWAMMWEGIMHSDWYLQEISFIRAHAIIYTIGLFVLIIAWLFYKKKNNHAFAIIFGLLVFLISFSIPKVHDGGDRLCYPLCRMYLGLPFAFVIFSLWIEESFSGTPDIRILLKFAPPILLCLVIIFAIHRYQDIKKLYPIEIKESFTVIIKPVENVKNVCDTINHFVSRYHAEPVVFEGLTKVYCYGSAALGYTYKSLYPAQERRKWLMKDENNILRNNFLLIPADTVFVSIAKSKNIPVKKLNSDPMIYLIDAKKRHLTDVLKELKIDVDVCF